MKVHIVWGVSEITQQAYLIGVYRNPDDAETLKGREADRRVTTEDVMESVDRNMILHLETGQQIELSPKDEIMVQEKSIYARQLKEGDAVKVKRRESTLDFHGDTKPVYVRILKIRTL